MTKIFLQSTAAQGGGIAVQFKMRPKRTYLPAVRYDRSQPGSHAAEW